MRKLNECELYQEIVEKGSLKQQIQTTVISKLNQNVGVLAPQHISLQLEQLKKKAKDSHFPLLAEALALYEKRGLVRLFNITGGTGKFPIPTSMPFLTAKAKAPVYDGDNSSNYSSLQEKAVFVNMAKIGNWNADGTEYNNLAAVTDLYTCLETGVVAYKMTVQGMSEQMFNNKQLLEHLTKLYAFLMRNAIVRARTTVGSSDFQKDSINFILGKFFLVYVLGKSPANVDDYAYLAVENRSSLSSLKFFEENSMIDYDSLSGFLKTVGDAYFSDPISLYEFESAWLRCYGDSTVFAIEYVPYLIHFLLAAWHNAVLGGGTRLTGLYANDLRKLGISKFYNALINALR